MNIPLRWRTCSLCLLFTSLAIVLLKLTISACRPLLPLSSPLYKQAIAVQRLTNDKFVERMVHQEIEQVIERRRTRLSEFCQQHEQIDLEPNL